MVVRLILLGLLVVFVVWGATTKPGRPFSWAMYSGSSKPFLWTSVDGSPLVPTLDDLRLAPDNHYLLLPDLHAITEEPHAPAPLHGVIVGSRGSWRVEYSAERGLVSVPVAEGSDLACLVRALRQFGCRHR